MAVPLRHANIPVGPERDAGREGHRGHVDVCDDHDAEQDLAGQARPFEGEEVDVEQQDGYLGEAEREVVKEDAIPGCL
jgi:hypothetical protein